MDHWNQVDPTTDPGYPNIVEFEEETPETPCQTLTMEEVHTDE